MPDEEGEPRLTSPPELLDEEEIPDVSPFEAQSECFQEILNEIDSMGEAVAAVWETNRGCPFRCTFCDWGSLTFSKVRRLSMDRIRGDVDWLTERTVDILYLADANVGMFDRDPKIIRYLCERREEHGSPGTLLYNPTKTKATHLPEIARNLHEHGLVPRSVMSIQHTHDEVLDALDRTNLSAEEIDALIDFNREHDIPMYVHLILGCPSDSYERWKSCLTELMEWGVHGDYHVFNFDILPNAPAAAEEYQEQWGIEITESRVLPYGGTRKDFSTPALAKKNMVTKTNTYDRSDWTRM